MPIDLLRCLMMFIFTCCLCRHASGAPSGAIYVSALHGDDEASGAAAAPLATLARAVTAARAQHADTIYLDADPAGSPHLLGETLALLPADSGLTITTEPAALGAGRRAVVSGGVAVTFSHRAGDTTAGGLPILSAAVPAGLAGRNATQMFLSSGERAIRARIPNAPPRGGAASHRR
jgi:hypothetical protein